MAGAVVADEEERGRVGVSGVPLYSLVAPRSAAGCVAPGLA